MWRPHYETRNLLNYFRVKQASAEKLNSSSIINETEAMVASTEHNDEQNKLDMLLQSPNPVVSVAKLPRFHHKPKAKYKKQIYLNAATVYVSLKKFFLLLQIFDGLRIMGSIKKK